MRLKSELYKKEQDDITDKIISILDLENKNTYTLYELDHNEDIQKQIMELIPEIRKWFDSDLDQCLYTTGSKGHNM